MRTSAGDDPWSPGEECPTPRAGSPFYKLSDDKTVPAVGSSKSESLHIWTPLALDVPLLRDEMSEDLVGATVAKEESDR